MSVPSWAVLWTAGPLSSAFEKKPGRRLGALGLCRAWREPPLFWTASSVPPPVRFEEWSCRPRSRGHPRRRKRGRARRPTRMLGRMRRRQRGHHRGGRPRSTAPCSLRCASRSAKYLRRQHPRGNRFFFAFLVPHVRGW